MQRTAKNERPLMNRHVVLCAGALPGCVSRNLRTLAAILFLTISLAAQDSPVGAAGNQLATDQTPAAATNSDALRKAAQNPIASLISVPVQNNTNFGIGPDDRSQGVLNIQPVIPVRLNEHWNLITRIITPIIFQPTFSHPVNQGGYGFGDMNPSFFASPGKTGKKNLGVRPNLGLPTGPNPVLGQGKVGLGPFLV